MLHDQFPTMSLPNLDVVDVGVGLQGEEQADDVGRGQKHADRVHQRSEEEERGSVTPRVGVCMMKVTD